MEADELLALRLERCAEWHAGLRTCERQDLREAAERLRAISREFDDAMRSSSGRLRSGAGDPPG